MSICYSASFCFLSNMGCPARLRPYLVPSCQQPSQAIGSRDSHSPCMLKVDAPKQKLKRLARTQLTWSMARPGKPWRRWCCWRHGRHGGHGDGHPRHAWCQPRDLQVTQPRPCVRQVTVRVHFLHIGLCCIFRNVMDASRWRRRRHGPGQGPMTCSQVSGFCSVRQALLAPATCKHMQAPASTGPNICFARVVVKLGFLDPNESCHGQFLGPPEFIVWLLDAFGCPVSKMMMMGVRASGVLRTCHVSVPM